MSRRECLVSGAAGEAYVVFGRHIVGPFWGYFAVGECLWPFPTHSAWVEEAENRG